MNPIPTSIALRDSIKMEHGKKKKKKTLTCHSSAVYRAERAASSIFSNLVIMTLLYKFTSGAISSAQTVTYKAGTLRALFSQTVMSHC